jgi:hypothetical protein
MVWCLCARGCPCNLGLDYVTWEVTFLLCFLLGFQINGMTALWIWGPGEGRMGLRGPTWGEEGVEAGGRRQLQVSGADNRHCVRGTGWGSMRGAEWHPGRNVPGLSGNVSTLLLVARCPVLGFPAGSPHSWDSGSGSPPQNSR